MPQYKASLSCSSFRKLSQQIREYRMGLESKCNELVRRLAEEGVDIATMKILELDAVDTSELVNSIECMEDGSPRNGARFVIFTTCDHAIYVEFGVGVKGSKSPHPDTSIVGWKYDVNEHGEEGWYYYKNGKWNWTKGMASRPFMYETGQELRKKINDVAQEVFGDD